MNLFKSKSELTIENVELARRWIEALRSGKYGQGRKYLRRGDNYCCLGVLCDLVDRTKWRTTIAPNEYLYVDELGNPPAFVMDAVGLFHSDGYEYDAIDTLVKLNDLDLASLARIADYVEKQLEEVLHGSE